jgi:hypothetical protein
MWLVWIATLAPTNAVEGIQTVVEAVFARFVNLA